MKDDQRLSCRDGQSCVERGVPLPVLFLKLDHDDVGTLQQHSRPDGVDSRAFAIPPKTGSARRPESPFRNHRWQHDPSPGRRTKPATQVPPPQRPVPCARGNESRRRGRRSRSSANSHQSKRQITCHRGESASAYLHSTATATGPRRPFASAIRSRGRAMPLCFSRFFRSLRFGALVVLVAPFANEVGAAADDPSSVVESAAPPPEWIWFDDSRTKSRTGAFTRSFVVDGRITQARARLAADFTTCRLVISGRTIVELDDFAPRQDLDVAEFLHAGENVVELHCDGSAGPSAVLFSLQVVLEDGTRQSFATDSSWEGRPVSPSGDAEGPPASPVDSLGELRHRSGSLGYEAIGSRRSTITHSGNKRCRRTNRPPGRLSRHCPASRSSDCGRHGPRRALGSAWRSILRGD